MAVMTARKATQRKKIPFGMPFEEWIKQEQRKPKTFTFKPRTSRERTVVEFNRVRQIIFKRIETGQPVPAHWVKAYFTLQSQLGAKPNKKVA